MQGVMFVGAFEEDEDSEWPWFWITPHVDEDFRLQSKKIQNAFLYKITPVT